jgi:hypothetical protein
MSELKLRPPDEQERFLIEADAPASVEVIL